MHRLIPVSVFCVCLFVLCSGCGPKQIKTYRVEGTIIIDGKPAENVLVTFVPKMDGKGLQASGVTDAQGVYKLTSVGGKQYGGAAVGDYVVTLSKREAKPLDKPFVEPISGKEFTETFIELMPISYRNAARSPLSATVNAGENKGFDFDIKIK
ncbi:MAG: hypothetical protein FWD31_00470 [Planctomycetaceae bacterium]|nr:hypothetical protein [Planctomycetaceae bacterium]